MWYSFLYDIFLDGGVSYWGGGNTILYFTNHSDMLSVLTASHDILLLTTDQCVFMLPWLRTSTQRDHLKCLVEAIQIDLYIFPKPHRFLYLLWASRCENPICLVKKLVLVDPDKDKKELVTHCSPLHSLHLLMATKFLLGLCPKCLENQVTKSLLPNWHRWHKTTDTSVVSDEPVTNHNDGEPVLFEEPVARQLGKSCWK
jgi:hypothetical protein